jgi:hypothetical protein
VSRGTRGAPHTELVAFLRIAVVTAFALGLLGATLPGDAGIAVATVAVAAVIAVPVVRITWLALRWARKGDARFAALAGVLLLVIAAGAGISLAR